MQNYQVSSVQLPVAQGFMHMQQFEAGAAKGSVLMIHGAVESGKIFYTRSGKGLAPYLAQQGYHVFVPDLRGKGQSLPHPKGGETYGQWEAICEELPRYIQHIQAIHPNLPLHIMAHSWGGVLVLAMLARRLEPMPVHSLCFLGSKRRISIQGPKRWLMIDFFWNWMGVRSTLKHGYLPAKRLKFGSEDEPAQFFLECNRWVYEKHWIDPRDGFNYHEAFKQVKLPPVLSITGKKDDVLGHIQDCQLLLDESYGSQAPRVLHAGKHTGYAHNYGHIDLLTHAEAPRDLYPQISDWVRQHTPSEFL